MLKGDNLSAAYASADLFVMPSESETLGFVVLEAMSSGLPVVAVAAGGLVDIMKNIVGEAGATAHPHGHQSPLPIRLAVPIRQPPKIVGGCVSVLLRCTR